MKNLLLFLIIVTLPLLLGGCGEKVIYDNVTLEIKDSIFIDPETGTPYSGKVASTRPNEIDQWKEMEGFLKNGKWHGKLVKYYNDGVMGGPSGSITKIDQDYDNGSIIGETSWYKNGEKAGERKYDNGIPKLFTAFNDDGVKTFETRYKDGVVFATIRFHLNGKMKHMAIPEPNGTTYISSKQKYWNEKGEPIDEFEAIELDQRVAAENKTIPLSDLLYKITDESVTITGCKKAYGKLVIPRKIENKYVTEIAFAAFNKRRYLNSITIPSGVNSIGIGSFGGCTYLTKVFFEKGSQLQEIPIESFTNCSNLSKFDIPENVKWIGDYAFSGCSSLDSITISSSVKEIGNASFLECVNLKSIIFLGDAPKEGRGVFKGSTPTIYRKPEANGWGDTFGGRPVKLISEKP